MILTIRSEQSGDESSIRRVHEAAFPTPLEGRLVDDLRPSGRLTVSLLAIMDNEVVGHIAFSPVSVNGISIGLGLAPLAVTPVLQGRGIGAELVRQGLAASQAAGAGCVVVLGSPAYYSRFGFSNASQWGLTDEYGGGDAFQALEFQPGAIPHSGGLVKYAPEFKVFTAE